jgi:hypothetical protein
MDVFSCKNIPSRIAICITMAIAAMRMKNSTQPGMELLGVA